MTKRRGSRKGREPLPRARAVVGVVGTSISSPFCAKIKKCHTPQDDDFVGVLTKTIQNKGPGSHTRSQLQAFFGPEFSGLNYQRKVSGRQRPARGFTQSEWSSSCPFGSKSRRELRFEASPRPSYFWAVSERSRA